MFGTDIGFAAACMVFAILLPLIWTKTNLRVTRENRFAALLPGVYLLFSLSTDGWEISMLGVYLGAVLLSLCFLLDNKKMVLALCMIGFLASASAFFTTTAYADYRIAHYSDEFREALSDMEENYVLADYKKIDFETLYEKYLPAFDAADHARDANAAFMAWNDVTNEIADGHVYVTTNTADNDKIRAARDAYRTKRMGSDYGFCLLPCADGSLVCVGITEDTDAYQQGMRNGMQILKMDGRSIDDVVEECVPCINTSEQSNYYLYQCLTATSVCSGTITVTYTDADGEEQKLELSGNGDLYPRYQKVAETFSHPVSADENSEYYHANLQVEMVSDTAACMYINDMMVESGIEFEDEKMADGISFPADAYEGDIYQGMKQMMTYQIMQAKAQGAETLILDLRSNHGGYVEAALAMASMFTDEEVFAYAEGYLDADGKTRVTEKHDTMAQNVWGDGEIAILVNSETASAAEIFAQIMQRLPNVTVYGLTKTCGCAQATSGVSYESITLYYPNALTLNEDGSVMIDTDASGISAFSPDVLAPVDDTAVHAIFNEGKDYLLLYVTGL